MNPILLFLIPSLLAILSLPIIANRHTAALCSALFAALSFCISIPLAHTVFTQATPLFFLKSNFMCDRLSAFFLVLNSFISMTTSYYAMGYLRNENRTALYPLIYRFYNTFFHLFMLGTFIVILSNNMALLWIAMETATISSVVLVALYQTQTALESAWKYLILCGMGIGLALLGTVLLYFSAYPYLDNSQALLWTSLIQVAPHLSPLILSVSFIFLFVGYGTKAGFFPLHNWLPDAYSEAPTPVSALLSGILTNVALFSLFRILLILQKTRLTPLSSHLFILFGTTSLLFAALSLFRQRQLKRLFAYSSIEHTGLIAIALGTGSSIGYFAALLHMAMHALTKTSVFFSAGSVIQRFKTQKISQLKGLTTTTPMTGWCLVLSGFILMGLPPSGLFWSELIILFSVFKTHPWLLLPVLTALFVAFIAFFSKLQRLGFSSRPIEFQSLPYSNQLNCPACLHLILVITAGIYIPYQCIMPIIYSLMKGV